MYLSRRSRKWAQRSVRPWSGASPWFASLYSSRSQWWFCRDREISIVSWCTRGIQPVGYMIMIMGDLRWGRRNSHYHETAAVCLVGRLNGSWESSASDSSSAIVAIAPMLVVITIVIIRGEGARRKGKKTKEKLHGSSRKRKIWGYWSRDKLI